MPVEALRCFMDVTGCHEASHEGVTGSVHCNMEALNARGGVTL